MSLSNPNTVVTEQRLSEFYTGILPYLDSGISVDSSISSTSENPVQNKVIYSALEDKADTADLGTAASKNVPSSGDAASTEVVLGNDSRLSDAREASDVYSWAKASTKPTYTASEVGSYTTTEVDNLISTLESGLDWKEAVATYSDIATTYPNPADGWTVNVKDTDYTYRYDGSAWVAISANAIPNATTSVNGLMTTTQVTKLEGIESGANVNVQPDWNVTDDSSDAFIKNKPTIPTVTDKADKVTNATSGNFAGLDANGNLTDSGSKASDFLTQHQDISGKADKSATVSTVTWDDSNTKLTKTINGTTTDVVTFAEGSNVTLSSSNGTITISASGGGSSATVLSETLAANDTTVTFTSIPTTGNNLIDFFSSDGSNYTDIDTSTSGQITLTYTASSSARTIYCRIEGV